MTDYAEHPFSPNLTEQAVTELKTVHDWLRWAVSRFNQGDIYLGHGTDNPWDEAAILLAHILYLPPLTDEKLFSVRLTSSERHAFVELLQKRIEQRIPAAYLTNQAYFAGLPFYVDERVLIPRSPIAELIKAKFEQQLQGKQPKRILDMCTGSACIAIACAYAFPEAEVDAVDISEDALEVAEMNVYNHAVENRVFPILSDTYQALAGQKYDLIVTNPPYVDAEDMADLPAEYRHEPELGLASGADGLWLTRHILHDAASHLTDDGVLICEVGNSMPELQHRYPDVPFQWLNFQSGGFGVFAITKQDLIKTQHLFEEQ